MRNTGWHVLGGWALSLVLGLGLAQAQAISVTDRPPTAPSAPLHVVASFSILADMVREVGGDDIRLDVLIGPMRDAHNFEPSPRDARVLGEAQVLVLNGLGFESWLPRLLDAAEFKGRTILASQGVSPRHLNEDAAVHEHDHAHEAGAVDPHAWQDLGKGVQYVQNIAQGLAQADPAHEAAYFARAVAYVQQLRKADAHWRQQLATVPQDHRVLATSHDAFAYLGAAYGIRILSLVGVSSGAEPSARAMAGLLQQIRTQHIHAIFLEHGSNAQALRRIAAEAGVTLGGSLYADTLDQPGHPAATYLGMFDWNMRLLLQAFTEK